QFKYIGEALILAIGLFLAGGAIKSGIVKFKEMDRTVTAKGLCEKEVKADKVTWPLKFKELGNDPAELYDRIESNTQTVVSFLKANGLSDDEISIAPPAMVDQQANMSYSSEQVRYRYKANCVVTVVSKNVDLVRKIVSNQAKLMRQGVTIVSNEYDETSNVTYEFTGLNDIKPEMIAEATKNARKTAEQFASDSNSELGKIKTADQGQFSINDRDQNTPWLKNIRVVTTVVYYLKD
ncbi:MAG: SIMPL domain-containing protein, partial [Lachnospiraceae bacterium]|nr:SIMPL domain-containing protein [Lachnospiraceae bacterium]